MNSPDFQIADVLAWARTKPADERYDFTNALSCALTQFGKATGREYLVNRGELRGVVPHGILVAAALSDTFGELTKALERLAEPNPIKRLWKRLTVSA